MRNKDPKHLLTRLLSTALAGAAFLTVWTADAPVADARSSGSRPALVITNDPLPPELQEKIYGAPQAQPQPASDITWQEPAAPMQDQALPPGSPLPGPVAVEAQPPPLMKADPAPVMAGSEPGAVSRTESWHSPVTSHLPWNRDEGRRTASAPVPLTPAPAPVEQVAPMAGGNTRMAAAPVYESRHPTITPDEISGSAYYGGAIGKTVVGRKADELESDISKLQARVSDLSRQLGTLESQGSGQAAAYYASVATINTQLQAGTTPGNPRLMQHLDVARQNLDQLSGNISDLNALALEVADVASTSAFLLESTRAAYTISGAVEEDHERLAVLEDSINGTVVTIDRLLNNVNDDITRTVAYLGTERENLQVLSLAISTGDLFGRSLAHRPYAQAQAQPASYAPAPVSAAVAAPAPVYQSGNDMMVPVPVQQDANAPYQGGGSVPAAAAAPANARPLAKIRFDREDVAFEQPIYMAVNEALTRYPGARFELVAVHPARGNAAQMAIESTKARRNAEKVLRSLTQMGLGVDRINMSYTPSAEAVNSEVHLYVR